MSGMRDIKRKIGSVKNTQKITNAMKMVSAAKLRRAQEAMEAALPYADKIYEVVQNISKRVNPEIHKLLQPKEEVKNIGVIVITSDRGLCGAFNSNVNKLFSQFRREHSDKDFKLICVGKNGYEYVKRRDYEIEEKYISFGGKITYDDAITIGDSAVKLFNDDEIDELYVVYNEFKSVASQIAKVKKILPLDFETEEETGESVVDYLYEPDPNTLVKEIIPRFINFTIYSCILESVAGEHGARMAAMDNATRNAGEMIKKLTLNYNKARQAAITTEILDIVNGAEALK
ncbi:ATP synthase gamma chain [Flexistipes sinusarabici DSM 4947]|uniref:ATP synthase gamma chain n=4 Tax=Flexistipes sinusarabici TaxID=2352 RepID=F8E9K9_FLESM|nr:ATP synthase F1 subunit gamma [Flexistipes sinusarabici]AEI15338.1 ATP synthase gamma chain [Flexistipes sinusarabici DSM 4947]